MATPVARLHHSPQAPNFMSCAHHEFRALSDTELRAVYDQHLVPEISALVDGERDYIINLANAAAVLYHGLKQHKGAGAVNWAGFYIVRPQTSTATAATATAHHRVSQRPDQSHVLCLGPFQGQTACLRIPFGRGVCGKCASEKKTQLVPDVHAFPGHIACDSASNSEIVVPIVDASGELRAIIDIDCPVKNGFNLIDQEGLERVASLLGQGCDWP